MSETNDATSTNSPGTATAVPGAAITATAAGWSNITPTFEVISNSIVKVLNILFLMSMFCCYNTMAGRPRPCLAIPSTLPTSAASAVFGQSHYQTLF